jgi:hypothetical protein
MRAVCAYLPVGRDGPVPLNARTCDEIGDVGAGGAALVQQRQRAGGPAPERGHAASAHRLGAAGQLVDQLLVDRVQSGPAEFLAAAAGASTVADSAVTQSSVLLP